MTEPLIGLGHGLDIGDLAPFLIEPQIPDGVANAQRDYAGDYTIHERGAFCVLLWPVVDSAENLDALLTQMGLEEDTDLQAAITVYVPTKRQRWHLYNAWANMPRALSYAFWPTNLRIMLNRVEQID